MKALEAIEQIEFGRQGWITASLGDLGVGVCQMMGVKRPESDWFDPIARVRKVVEARAEIKPQTARTFLDLLKDGKVPTWALRCFDVEKIRRAL